MKKEKTKKHEGNSKKRQKKRGKPRDKEEKKEPNRISFKWLVNSTVVILWGPAGCRFGPVVAASLWLR
jgi:hypothetical protein